MKKLTTEEFIEKAKKIHGDKYDYSLVDYKKSHSNIKIICKIHGIFEQLPNNHLGGKGCIKCTNKEKLNIKIFIDRSNKIHNNKYKYELINNLNKLSYINIICPIHGKFIQRISSHIGGKNGCPNCNESKGELKISKFLDKNGIKFKRQFTFEKCKNKQNLPFDFYLIDYNICIEYDGEQHFNPIKYFGGPKRMQKIKLNDSIKNKFCSDYGIKIIRISYLNYDKIESYLESILSTIG